MNIPWSENPAGLYDSFYKGYPYFGSASYIGSKEYFGYMSDSGQTDTSVVYIIIHLMNKLLFNQVNKKLLQLFTILINQLILLWREIAFQPYDANNPTDTTVKLVTLDYICRG